MNRGDVVVFTGSDRQDLTIGKQYVIMDADSNGTAIALTNDKECSMFYDSNLFTTLYAPGVQVVSLKSTLVRTLGKSYSIIAVYVAADGSVDITINTDHNVAMTLHASGFKLLHEGDSQEEAVVDTRTEQQRLFDFFKNDNDNMFYSG